MCPLEPNKAHNNETHGHEPQRHEPQDIAARNTVQPSSGAQNTEPQNHAAQSNEVQDADGQGRVVEKPPRSFKLIVAYDGGEFYGWQRQSAARTVQATLEDAIAALTGDSVVHLLASSRTDTGVHALGQCATFRSHRWKADASNLPMALNTRLPADVVVRSACEVPMGFNPIRDARGKRYRYTLYASRTSNPLARRQAWWVKRPLDVDLMRAAARLLLGKHDFASFQTAGSPRVSTVRTVAAIDISSHDYLDGQMVTIEIEADGFLYNMVRSVVGTLVLPGLKRKPISWVGDVLEATERQKAGPTAPPHGLCLLEIYFQPTAERTSCA